MRLHREQQATKNINNIRPPLGKQNNTLSAVLLLLKVVKLPFRRSVSH